MNWSNLALGAEARRRSAAFTNWICTEAKADVANVG